MRSLHAFDWSRNDWRPFPGYPALPDTPDAEISVYGYACIRDDRRGPVSPGELRNVSWCGHLHGSVAEASRCWHEWRKAAPRKEADRLIFRAWTDQRRGTSFEAKPLLIWNRLETHAPLPEREARHPHTPLVVVIRDEAGERETTSDTYQALAPRPAPLDQQELEFDGHEVRVIDGRFAAIDVMRALGLKDPKGAWYKAKKQYPALVAESATRQIGRFRLDTISETGLYKLCMVAGGPKADAFREWAAQLIQSWRKGTLAPVPARSETTALAPRTGRIQALQRAAAALRRAEKLARQLADVELKTAELMEGTSE